jgi:hypothetical protein
MGFLAPWFLVGVAALGLPVYVHLLRRHTTTPRPFASLMFFERGTQSSTRHKRLRYLLLFALRFGLLLLLVLAFANPFLRRAGLGDGRLLIIAVDNSFSMRAGTRLADAKQAAFAVLASRPSGQHAQIMALGDHLQVLTQSIQDPGALRAALEGIQAGDSHGNFGELGHGMRALAETIHTPVELHLFSDMQKSDMPANFADMVLPGNVTLVLHSISKAPPPPNWTVESVTAPSQLADIKDPRVSHVQAIIVGYNTPVATLTVSLLINGKPVATRKVDVPANGHATVEFHPLEVAYGSNRVEVRIDPADTFPADDVSALSVKRSDPERVLFVHQSGDARSPLYFGTALAAAAQSSFVLQSINVEQSTDIDPSKYAFIVISDAMALPTLFENSLTHYVRGGGSVLIAAGTSTARPTRIPLFDEPSLSAHDYARTGKFASVGSTDSTHPVIRDTPGDDAAGSPQASGNSSDWSTAKFYYAAVVDPAHSRVVMRLADGTPLLLDKQLGEGHVLLLATGMDNLTNDLPVQPAFVAFVDRAARYLSGMDRLSGTRLVDSFVQLRTTSPRPNDQPVNVEVVDPDGHRPLSLSEASTIESYQLTRAGFYQVRFANGKEALLAVNPDRRESNLEPIPDDILSLWSGSPSTGNPGTGINSTPTVSASDTNLVSSVWWYVMLLGLAVAVAEGIISANYLGTQREDA